MQRLAVVSAELVKACGEERGRAGGLTGTESDRRGGGLSGTKQLLAVLAVFSTSCSVD